MFKEYFKNISNDSFDEFSTTSVQALKKIVNNKSVILEMLDHVLEDEVLIEKSECYDFLDKIVIFSDEEKGVYARVSLFNNKYSNRIHYHRWNYSAYILSGGYKQMIYGIANGNEDITNLYPYTPKLIEQLSKGNYYSLHHSMIHSVIAIPDSVSICIRGCAYKDKFQAIDPATGNSWWQFGSKMEAKEERIMKSLYGDALRKRIEHIKKIIKLEGEYYV